MRLCFRVTGNKQNWKCTWKTRVRLIWVFLAKLTHISDNLINKYTRKFGKKIIQMYIFNIHFIRMRSQNWTQTERIAIKGQQWLVCKGIRNSPKMYSISYLQRDDECLRGTVPMRKWKLTTHFLKSEDSFVRNAYEWNIAFSFRSINFPKLD